MRPRTSEVDQRGANGSVLMRVFQYYSVAFTAPQPVRAPAHVLVLVDLGNVVRSRDSVLRSAVSRRTLEYLSLCRDRPPAR